VLSCQPTFPGIQSASGFVFTSLKLSRSWFGCRCVVITSAQGSNFVVTGHLQVDIFWNGLLLCWTTFASVQHLLLALCLHH
jgi:hypothetical protein